jgi:hypothetical protein
VFVSVHQKLNILISVSHSRSVGKHNSTVNTDIRNIVSSENIIGNLSGKNLSHGVDVCRDKKGKNKSDIRITVFSVTFPFVILSYYIQH